MLEKVSFGVVAFALLWPGFKVVTARNLVHTVFWLGLTLASTAVLFIMLQAPFLAAIQLILYTGGLLTLMLFGVMLTARDQGLLTVPNASHRRAFGGLLAVAAFAMLAMAITQTTTLPASPTAPITTQQLGALVFTEQALAFEVLAVLLLAVTLGAIVFARRGDAGSATENTANSIPARKPLPAPNAAVSQAKGA